MSGEKGEPESGTVEAMIALLEPADRRAFTDRFADFAEALEQDLVLDPDFGNDLMRAVRITLARRGQLPGQRIKGRPRNATVMETRR